MKACRSSAEDLTMWLNPSVSGFHSRTNRASMVPRSLSLTEMFVRSLQITVENAKPKCEYSVGGSIPPTNVFLRRRFKFAASFQAGAHFSSNLVNVKAPQQR